MFRSARVWVACIVLGAIGLGVFAYKHQVLGFPATPGEETEFWDLEAKIEFVGRGGSAEVRIARAQDTEHLLVLNESYLTPSGFGVRRTRLRNGSDRFAEFERRSLATRATVFYRATLVDLDSGMDRAAPPPRARSPYDAETRAAAAREEQTPFLFALDNIISRAEEGSADQDGFIDQIVQILAVGNDPEVQALRAGGPRGLGEPARRLSVVLNAADVPARRVAGLRIEASARDVPIVEWVEYWSRDQWRAIDPLTGDDLDADMLMPLSTTDRSLVRHSGVRDVYVSYAVERRPEDAVTEALRQGSERAPLLAALSLYNLPLHAQDVFEVLLLVPVGALVIAFLRQVVGLASFGTFMPVLIALSFRETSLLTGVILFTGIVFIGLSLRAYFDRLQLLVVPRLAAILTLVTLMMALIALVGTAFNIPLGLSISLFPLVILTMTIERMSLTWDEFGAREALVQGAGSLLAAVICYFVTTNRLIEHVAFTFPELLLAALALMIMLGRYNGYKLTEYLRFRMFAERDQA